MKTKSLLKSLLTAFAGLTILASSPSAQAFNGKLEGIKSEKKGSSYVRANAFYNLPFNIKGVTFTEFYTGGKGYFGQTFLEKPLKKGFNFRARAIHVNNPLTKFSPIGLSFSVPKLPKGLSAKLKLDPLWFKSNGERIPNKLDLGYFVSVDLPYGFKASGFGGWNVADKKGVQWGYGEANLEREIAKGVSIGYNPVLLNQGGAVPKVEHRMNVGVRF